MCRCVKTIYRYWVICLLDQTLKRFMLTADTEHQRINRVMILAIETPKFVIDVPSIWQEAHHKQGIKCTHSYISRGITISGGSPLRKWSILVQVCGSFERLVRCECMSSVCTSGMFLYQLPDRIIQLPEGNSSPRGRTEKSERERMKKGSKIDPCVGWRTGVWQGLVRQISEWRDEREPVCQA